jgi:hypothetical protein
MNERNKQHTQSKKQGSLHNLSNDNIIIIIINNNNNNNNNSLLVKLVNSAARGHLQGQLRIKLN